MDTGIDVVPLLEREAELAALAEHAGEARQGPAGWCSSPARRKLFISVKTVDHHVSAVLAKLDAPTRGAAATRAATLGLITTSR